MFLCVLIVRSPFLILWGGFLLVVIILTIFQIKNSVSTGSFNKGVVREIVMTLNLVV